VRTHTLDVQRQEPLYESQRTRVRRLWLRPDGSTVVGKEPLGPDAAQRVRHETSILDRLAQVPGVVRLAAGGTGPSTIVLEDLAGTALAEVVQAGPLDVPTVLRYALELTRTVAAVHEHGVVHKDINPANIVLAGPRRRPVLLDFELASTFAEERPGFTHHREMVGTLAYLAPEQTGRTGLAVDHRADLYALGATFYEMVSGQPPFGDGEALQLVHDTLVLVPVPLVERDPSVPPQLSAIVARLLEKEPDRRYQSAAGLAHDLAALCDGRLGQLGERDYPARLAAPSRPVGRDLEIAALRRAFTAALDSPDRAALVAGGAGVGKSTLINELRPIVATRGGWFVAGKFDQYQQDATSGAVIQAMRAMCRLLLAEPEAELAGQRDRIGAAIGANAGLLAMVMPELGVLLGGSAAPAASGEDPGDVANRMRRAGVELLRAVVSPQRPLVMVLDDLQWAATATLEFVDLVLTDESLRGLLLVGAYRPAEVDEAHPLSAMCARWRRLGVAPPVLELSNLEPAGLGMLLAEMLRLPAARATALARAVGGRTAGNPYDTIELVNALRRDGVLVLGTDGWDWDEAAIRRYVGCGDVVDLLRDRIDALAAPGRELLAAMSCLGGEIQLDRLAAALDRPVATVRDELAQALEDGLLMLEQDTVRFRHDRVQQAAHDGLHARARQSLRLRLARRLAAAGQHAEAAEQYLSNVDNLTDAGELRAAAALFQVAAARARLTSNNAIADRFLSAAASVFDTLGTGPEDPALLDLEIARHAVLCGLGRLDEADGVYASIVRRRPDALRLAPAAGLQAGSLTNRGRPQEAISLGIAVLAALGFPGPEADLAAEIARRTPDVFAWIEHASVDADLARPEVTDPRVPAAALLINRIGPAAYLASPLLINWTVLEGHRMWVEFGPCPPVVAIFSGAGLSTFGAPEDFATRGRILRHVLAVGEARGYQQATANALMIHAMSCSPWLEPMPESIRQSRMSREALLHHGDGAMACYTYTATVSGSLDCASTLDEVRADAEAGMALTERVGQTISTATYGTYRQLVRALRGDTDAPGSFADHSFDEDAFPAAHLAANAYAVACLYVNRALVAAIRGDMAALARDIDAAAPLLFIVQGTSHAHGQLLRGLSLAHRAATAPPDQRPALLAQLDEVREWWARRAAQAPGNFGHLLHLVDAERARATGDVEAALRGFDTAGRSADARDRVWHQALIAERAAHCHLAYGLERTGHQLLAEARARYAAWGATGKVREMDEAYPFLDSAVRPARSAARLTVDSRRTSSMSADAIDMMAILRASQALSGETNLDRLHAALAEQLGAITGATTVHLALCGDEEEPAGPLPLTALRYVERTQETLLVHDATQDDRFARDPYLAGMVRCSLLVVPVLNQGALRAVLLLANDRTAGAFTASRLDAVMLIAGQLAVSLDNALLYRSLEDRVARRTQELGEANRQLEILSSTDALTKLANRRRFAEILDLEWARATRSGQPISIVLLDIDHFKKYNDHYGHLGGDDCLRQVGAAIAESARRATDLACRYGGEEFAIILPETGDEGGATVAERVRSAVAGLAQPHALADHGIVTVSVGYATMVPERASPPETLVQAADTALYEAKSAGRNRTCRYRP
jgi:diguanylate cyclase (GGDEF)-like protein